MTNNDIDISNIFIMFYSSCHMDSLPISETQITLLTFVYFQVPAVEGITPTITASTVYTPPCPTPSTLAPLLPIMPRPAPHCTGSPQGLRHTMVTKATGRVTQHGLTFTIITTTQHHSIYRPAHSLKCIPHTIWYDRYSHRYETMEMRPSLFSHL